MTEHYSININGSSVLQNKCIWMENQSGTLN